MKRVLASILMTVVLLLSLLVPAGAAKADGNTAPYRNSVVIWNADEDWGDEFELDTKNQVEGQGCASIDLHTSEGIHRAQRCISPADATGMDTLEFDLYLSSIEYVRDFRAPNRLGALEIASENGAIYFDMRILLSMIEEHDLVRGWNHIVLPLDPLAVYLGDFDASRINQISIYWESTAWFGVKSIIKFDRFVLTDRETVAQEDPTVKQTLSTYADLLTQLKEHYAACMMVPRENVFEADVDIAPLLEQNAAILSSYSDIPAEDRAILDAKGYRYILLESRFRAREYDDVKETLTQVSDLILQILSLREYTDEGALTAINFKDAREKMETVWTAYEGLLKKQKSALAEQGYLDILKALDKALYTHTHDSVLEEVSDEHLACPASCTSGALYYYSCALCGEKGTETFERGEPLGHDLTEGYVSCEADGHSMKCRRCEEYVDVIPHTFGEWETVREATEGESGLKQRSCAECTYVETQEIVYVAPKPQTPQTPAVPVAPSDDGCSAVLVSGAPAMLALIAAAGWMVRKKKK